MEQCFKQESETIKVINNYSFFEKSSEKSVSLKSNFNVKNVLSDGSKRQLKRTRNYKLDAWSLPPHLDYFHNKGLIPQGTHNSCIELSAGKNISWLWQDLVAARDGNLRYRHPHHSDMVGKIFSIKEDYIKNLLLPIARNTVNLVEDALNDFVFATACSSNHFQESLLAINRVGQLFPHHIVIFYDLGLMEYESYQVRH